MPKSEPVTLSAIANLFHKELQPIQTTMTQLKTKFSHLQISVEGQLQEDTSVTQKINDDLSERCAILESNVENVHGEASKMAERIIDCETAILDIKEYMMGMTDGAISGSVPAMTHTQASSELNMLKAASIGSSSVLCTSISSCQFGFIRNGPIS